MARGQAANDDFAVFVTERFESLDEGSQDVILCLITHGDQHLRDIKKNTGLPLKDVAVRLLQLSLSGWITWRKIPGVETRATLVIDREVLARAIHGTLKQWLADNPEPIDRVPRVRRRDRTNRSAGGKAQPKRRRRPHG